MCCVWAFWAGIGGAAAAVALEKRGFRVVMLEADASFDTRKQGYGFTIQAHGPLQVMRHLCVYI